MLHRLSLLVVAAVVAASCDANNATQSPTQPTPANNAPSITVSTTSPTALAQRVSNPFCPTVAPFNVPFVVVVSSGLFPVVVTSIRLQFVDTAGFGMPLVTLPAPVPTAQIGTSLALARSQFFPVVLPIGCASGFKGNVQIAVQTRDAQGRIETNHATLSVQ
jgi:hypothetical protein